MARSAIATDIFNRANNPVETGNTDWTQLNPGYSSLQVDTNAVSPWIGENGADVPAARWTGAGTWTADQYAKIQIVGYSFDNTRKATVLVRASGQNATRTYYEAYLYSNSGTIGTASIKLYKMVSGTYTQLGSTWTDGGFAINDFFELEAEGTTLRICKNGTSIGHDVTDSAIAGSSSTTAGIGGGGDNWEGGNITSATPPTPDQFDAVTVAEVITPNLKNMPKVFN